MRTLEKNRTMNLSKPHPHKNGSGWYKTGKLFNFSCRIVYDAWSDTYSYIVGKNDCVFNSLWHDQCWETEDECRIACENLCKEKYATHKGVF